MIAHVFGRVVEKVGSSLIVDVHGVGYEVQVAQLDFDAYVLDQEAKLYTYHHVREQVEELFGFSSLAGKRLFELLISVQGVGPKAALAILSLGSAEDVRRAIAAEDVSYIQRASGVGKRTAERVVVDLRDKVGGAGVSSSFTAASGQKPLNDEALDALMALGYTLRDATEALEEVDPALTTADRIREALQGVRR